MMPKVHEIEISLLRALQTLGGKAPAKDVYPLVTKEFPQLTPGDIAEQLPSGGNKWTNRIQWARQGLLERGEMASGGFGVWAITEEGVARLAAVANRKTPPVSHEPVASDFEETVDDYLSAFRARVLQKLLDLKPPQFEEFAGVLLRGYGFQKVVVSGKSGDGGIDGHGELKVGMAVMRAAFQCKKWKDTVGPKEVQAFRGAIQGQFEQGYFFITSTFTKAAQQQSIKSGAAPIILFDGDQVVRIMMDKGIGIRARPVEIYEDQIETLFEK
jgi:restriction system protein